MVHVIIEQSWSTPTGEGNGQRLGPPRLVGTEPSREEAELRAIALASAFHHHNYNGEGDGHSYWWGREENGHEVHRFVVRPATP